MSTKWIIAIIVGVGLLVVGTIGAVGIIGYYISTRNQAINYEQQFEACKSECKTSLDNAWKTIQGKYQLKNDYATEMKSMIDAAVVGRSGGSLFKMVTETMPGLDASIYKDVMATIEGKRDQFKRSLDTQIAIKKEHQMLRLSFPSSLVAGGRPELVLMLVTSDKTEEAFKTGVENDIELKK